MTTRLDLLREQQGDSGVSPDLLTTCLDLLREQQGGLIPRADWPREVALGYN